MNQSDQTKYRFVVAMKECMETSSVDNVTVTEIVKKAHLTRQTFYRNFLDKYDLINWYFDKILLESFKEMGRGNNIYSGLVKKFTYIQKEKLFFKIAFQSKDRNSLKEHDFELIFDFYSNLLKHENIILNSDTIFLLEMYCRGSIEMTDQWLTKNLMLSPEEMATLLIDSMPQKLSQIFDSLNALK